MPERVPDGWCAALGVWCAEPGGYCHEYKAWCPNDIADENYKIPSADGALLKADAMSGAEFEAWCAALLKKMGYSEVYTTAVSGDQGVDITAKKGGIKYAIQCKRYSTDLGNHPVQEVFAGKAMYGCNVGIVMTNRYFTQGARDLAKATGTLLWDRSKLRSMLQEIGETI